MKQMFFKGLLMIFDEIRQIALSFPAVEEHLVFGGPTFRIGKRFLACIAKIDQNTLCLKVPDPLEREFLLTTKPDIYYMTDHYATFECVLVRMPQADPEELRELFEQAWRAYAPKKLVANYQANL
jgi:hypothetical protein